MVKPKPYQNFRGSSAVHHNNNDNKDGMVTQISRLKNLRGSEQLIHRNGTQGVITNTNKKIQHDF